MGGSLLNCRRNASWTETTDSQIAAHTKRFLLRSRHYRCVTSQDRKEEGSVLRMSRNFEHLLFRSMWGNLTCACVFKTVMADGNPSNHFDTPCIFKKPRHIFLKNLAIRIYLSVIKVSMKKFTLTGNKQIFSDIPKFWRYLIGLFPRKAFPSSAPYLNSVTRPKPVYSDAVTASPPEKQAALFKAHPL